MYLSTVDSRFDTLINPVVYQNSVYRIVLLQIHLPPVVPITLAAVRGVMIEDTVHVSVDCPCGNSTPSN